MSQNPRRTQLEQAAREWLANSDVASEPGWLRKRRSEAREYFLSNGIPTNRQEEFRFLPLAGVASRAFSLATASTAGHESTPTRAKCVASIGFFNGHPTGSASQLPTGLRIERLSDVLKAAPDALEPYFGSLASPIHGFAAIGLSSFKDAWVVRVAAGSSIELPLDVVVQQWGTGQWSVPRLLMILEAGSQLTLVERHLPSKDGGPELTTGVFEFFLEASARLQHVRLCSRGPQETELTTTAVRVATDAHYHSWTATNRGMLTRFDTHVNLVGPGARADLDGLYIASGSDIVDHHTRVIHECENTTVQESYKGIVDDQAQAVFDGQIVVRPGAMGTNAQQFNRNLLMSDRAIVHTKPQLEIDADDVVCSHGATVGKLDEQQLFYLQSRGISGEQAKRMLTTAFAAELIDRCPLRQTSLLNGYLPAASSDAENLFGDDERE